MSPKETTVATLPDELDERLRPEERPDPTQVVESDGDVIVDIDDDRATDQTHAETPAPKTRRRRRRIPTPRQRRPRWTPTATGSPTSWS